MPRDSRSTPPRNTPVLDEATRALIRAKARQIASRSPGRSAEVGELEQDLALEVLGRLGRFDAEKAELARFVRLLLAHAVATVLRDRRRRSRRAPAPLAALVRQGGPSAEPAEEDPAEEVALALDVAGVLAALPPRLRRVAEALKTDSVTAAARRLRVSRAAVYRRLAELRRAFAAAGLGEILPPPGHSARGRGSSSVRRPPLREGE
jgi:DNA-directed RNA polymerase specialized sigma24 family protein